MAGVLYAIAMAYVLAGETHALPDLASGLKSLVSPDYPNLARRDDSAVQWADTMHCIRAGEMMASGIRRVGDAKGDARDKQLSYPAYEAVDRQYIEEQTVSSESPNLLHYDEIFDSAAENVAVMWRVVERAVCAGDATGLPLCEEWNLDTGRDGHDKLVFW
ncbi:MAG: hypothetical protein ACYDHC_05825 [Desulfuromonadaceae bacterium]